MVIQAARIAEVLGGDETLRRDVRSLRDLSDVVEEGLPKAAYKHVFAFLRDLSLPPEPLRRLKAVTIPPATFKRRRDRLSPAESERIERLARVAAMAKELWRNNKDAGEFLATPHPALGGRTPLEMSLSDLGVRQVEGLVANIAYGLPV